MRLILLTMSLLFVGCAAVPLKMHDAALQNAFQQGQQSVAPQLQQCNDQLQKAMQYIQQSQQKPVKK